MPPGFRPLPQPLPPARLPASRGSESVALVVGCVASAYEPGARAALARLLDAADLQLELPNGQGCCGTAAAHAGDARQADLLADRNRRAFAGRDVVLSLASGCQQRLVDSLAGASQVHDALVFLEARAERLRFRSARGRRIALHLPCSQRVLGSEGAVRRLLGRVPDLDLVVLADTGCCGAAGLHMLAEPDRAARLRQPLLAALAASGATELLSANVGCRLHLAGGTTMPVRHPLEFLAEQLA